MNTTTSLVETREQALLRLGRKARQEGVRLYRDARDGRHYASSVSQPGQLHYITAVSCDCQGFITYQRCKHHAALLIALGWLTDPDPDPPSPIAPLVGRIVRCESCRGLGEIHYEAFDGNGRIVGDWIICAACRGCGVEKQAA